MSSIGFLRGAVVFGVLLVLHYTLRPLLGWRPAMDFLVIAALLAAVRVRPGIAAVLGFCLGLAADSIVPSALGAGALAMSGIAFTASWLKAIFFADNLVLNAGFFFVGKWMFDVIQVVTEQRLDTGEMLVQLLLWSPLAALNTAAAGVVLLIMLRPVLETRRA
jgi:rod shape-determining protein MreD